MTNSQHPASPASNAADPSPTAGPGSSAADDRTAGSTAAAARLRELGATYFRTQHTYDPWNASLLGLSEFDHLVGDPRAEAGQLAAAELGAVRRAAEEIDPAILTGTDRVDREVLIALARGAENDAADALWAANASATTYVSRQGLVFQTIPVMSTATPAGEAAYLSRLEGLPGLFAGLGERYREEAARGRFPTRVGVQHAVDELTGYLALPLAEDILLGPALHSGSRDRAAEMVSERIRPAMADLAATLRSDLLPVARPDDRVGIGNIPGGAEAYARATARHTTTDLTPEQIHQIGHQAIAELGGQWQTVGQRALGTSDIPEIFRILRTDPALRFETSAQIVAVAQAALDRAIAASDRYYEGPSIGPCEIVEINAVEAEHGSLAYYRPPSVDGSRPGAHCLLATDPGNRFRFEYEALAFHESVPGHHLQLSCCQQLDIPVYRRYLDVEACAFNEGWGLYSEVLAEELGLYSSDLDVLGRLSFTALRACRLVIDTGMHHLGWSRERAMAFMRDNTATTESNIRNEVDRYIAWPGQALAYMVGQREILRVRQDARARLGDRFSLPGFHRRVLEHGAVPLSVLARNVANWDQDPAHQPAQEQPWN